MKAAQTLARAQIYLTQTQPARLCAATACASLSVGRLIDSDVLICVARGNATNELQALPHWRISAGSYMELAQGCRDKAELKAMQQAFSHEAGDVLAITQPISDLACTLVEKYALSHNVHLADALIAANAMINAMPLLTGNGKHFSAIKGLKIQVFKPVALS